MKASVLALATVIGIATAQNLAGQPPCAVCSQTPQPTQNLTSSTERLPLLRNSSRRLRPLRRSLPMRQRQKRHPNRRDTVLPLSLQWFRIGTGCIRGAGAVLGLQSDCGLAYDSDIHWACELDGYEWIQQVDGGEHHNGHHVNYDIYLGGLFLVEPSYDQSGDNKPCNN